MRISQKLLSRKGQSAVETALILPIIIIIITGIIDFGLTFNNYLIINNASREGARNAAVGASDSQIVSNIKDMASTLDQSKLKITIVPDGSTRKAGNEVTITVEYDNDLITPVIGSLVGKTLHLKAKTVMRIE